MVEQENLEGGQNLEEELLVSCQRFGTADRIFFQTVAKLANGNDGEADITRFVSRKMTPNRGRIRTDQVDPNRRVEQIHALFLSLFKQISKASTNGLTLIANKLEIARKFIQGSEDGRQGIFGFRKKHNRFTQPLDENAVAGNTEFQREANSLTAPGHEDLGLG